MKLAAIIDALVAAGAKPEMLAATVRAYEETKEAEDEARLAKKRAANAERQRRFRESRNADNALQSVTERDERDAASPPIKSPPITPKKLTPPNTSLRSDTSAREIFATEFWPAYPRKTERKAAEAKFIALVRSGVDPAAMVAGARRYAASKPEPKFTKHPTTWLNRGCWEDEQLPRDGPSRSPRSVLARMATGEYWNDPDEQPSLAEPRIAQPAAVDARSGGYVGQLPQRGGDDLDSGPLLDLRPERAG